MSDRTFKRERLAVDCLITATAVLCVAGVVAQFLPLPDGWRMGLYVICTAAFAGVAGFSLWVANAAAACAQQLAETRDRHPWAFGIALACAGTTGLVSVLGVHLGWLILIDERQALPSALAIDAAGLVLAFVKVAMGFVIKACEGVADETDSATETLLAVKNRRISDLEDELRKLRSQAENLSAANDVEAPRSEPRRASASASRAVARALRDTTPSRRSRAPAEIRERTERAPPLSEAEVREALAELTSAGEVISFAAVAKRRGVPYSRVERSPGRHLIEAARAAA